MIFACHPDFIGMTLINKKGGDAYGQVPKRILLVPPPLKVRGARSRLCRGCSIKSAGVIKGFAKGKRKLPGPGMC